jgi:hypothetical protein
MTMQPKKVDASAKSCSDEGGVEVDDGRESGCCRCASFSCKPSVPVPSFEVSKERDGGMLVLARRMCLPGYLLPSALYYYVVVVNSQRCPCLLLRPSHGREVLQCFSAGASASVRTRDWCGCKHDAGGRFLDLPLFDQPPCWFSFPPRYNSSLAATALLHCLYYSYIGTGLPHALQKAG